MPPPQKVSPRPARPQAARARPVDRLMEIIRARRSTRRFLNRPVPAEAITTILEAARWAPSGANAQPWEFIVVTDRATRLAMAEMFAEGYAGDRRLNPEFPVGGTAYMKTAPVFIVVLGDPRLKEAFLRARAEMLYYQSIGVCIEHMFLAATALGLGGVWISALARADKALRPLLGVPEPLEILSVFATGYAARPGGSRYRRPLDAMVHHDRYDMTKFRGDEAIRAFIAQRDRLIWARDLKR